MRQPRSECIALIRVITLPAARSCLLTQRRISKRLIYRKYLKMRTLPPRYE